MVLHRIFAGQVFKILDILMVDLVQNFLKVLRSDPVHIGVKLLLLFLGQQ